MIQNYTDVTTFDIDSYIPDYSTPVSLKKNPTKRDKLAHRKMSWVKRQIDWASTTRALIGVDPKKILNWRELERRYKEHEKKYFTVDRLFWSALEQIHREKVGKPNVQSLICVSPEKILIYSPGRGYTIENLEWAIKRLKLDPETYGYYQVISFQDGGEYIGRLLTRGNRLNKIASLYRDYFRIAVTHRINKFLESQPNKGYGIFDQFNFVIQNGDSTYIVCSDQYRKVKFLEGRIMLSSQQMSLDLCNPENV